MEQTDRLGEESESEGRIVLRAPLEHDLVHARRATRRPSVALGAMDDPQAFADAHIAAFNDAVLTQDFNRFIERFSDDAKMRFENVPGAGELEFNGSPAIAAAYAQQPPDDEIVLTGPARSDGEAVVIPFA